MMMGLGVLGKSPIPWCEEWFFRGQGRGFVEATIWPWRPPVSCLQTLGRYLGVTGGDGVAFPAASVPFVLPLGSPEVGGPARALYLFAGYGLSDPAC
jgi:hypothetical protein